jgi:hypothetical protein
LQIQDATKNDDIVGSIPPVISLPSKTDSVVNTAPVANAGPDVSVLGNTYILNGSYYDKEKNVKEVTWIMITGSNSLTLENKYALSTKLNSLDTGSYYLELTVTDQMGLFDKDTVIVKFETVSGNEREIIYKDLTWISPWYNNIEIPKFTDLIHRDSSFSLYIKRDIDNIWKRVSPTNDTSTAQYDYFIIIKNSSFYNDGSLYISYYGQDIEIHRR